MLERAAAAWGEWQAAAAHTTDLESGTAMLQGVTAHQLGHRHASCAPFSMLGRIWLTGLYGFCCHPIARLHASGCQILLSLAGVLHERAFLLREVPLSCVLFRLCHKGQLVIPSMVPSSIVHTALLLSAQGRSISFIVKVVCARACKFVFLFLLVMVPGFGLPSSSTYHCQSCTLRI